LSDCRGTVIRGDEGEEWRISKGTPKVGERSHVKERGFFTSVDGRGKASWGGVTLPFHGGSNRGKTEEMGGELAGGRYDAVHLGEQREEFQAKVSEKEKKDGTREKL